MAEGLRVLNGFSDSRFNKSPFVLLSQAGVVNAATREAALFIGTNDYQAPSVYGACYRTGGYWHLAGIAYPRITIDPHLGVPMLRALRAKALMPYLFAEAIDTPKSAIPELAWRAANLEGGDQEEADALGRLLASVLHRPREFNERYRDRQLGGLTREELLVMIGGHHRFNYPVNLGEFRRDMAGGQIAQFPIPGEVVRENNRLLEEHNRWLHSYA